MGAVLVDHTTNAFLFFGCHVPSIWVDRWQTNGKEQDICEAELLPVRISNLGATTLQLTSHQLHRQRLGVVLTHERLVTALGRAGNCPRRLVCRHA